jgi:four helix bundle protein
MKENIIKDKSFSFAIKVVKLYQYLTETKKEYVLSKQVLRSGTSIGANVHESEHAQSKLDFIHKLSISLKEANETEYWFDLLFHSGYINHELFQELSNDIKEIIRILIAIINSSKKGNAVKSNSVKQ